MTGWLTRRLLEALAITLAVVTLVFAAIHAAPGTPFLPAEGRPLNAESEARLRAQFGLDRPLPVQYARWIAGVARGDFGESFRQRRPVSAAVRGAIPNTLVLTGAALVIDFVLGLTLALVQATRAGGRRDGAITAGTLLFYSLPTFWLGLVLLLVFGQWLHWFPVGGVIDPVMHASMSTWGRLLDRLHHLALPALTLGLVGAAGTARYQRAALLEILGQAFVRTARAKGLTDRAILVRHALRNALLPGITLLGLSLPFLLTGAVVVETVFAYPGLGKLTADAIAGRDYPVVMATALIASLMVVAGSLIADVLYAAADPRVRAAEGA